MQTVADLQLFHVLKYTITGNKYKFAQIVQETATNVHKFGQLLYKIITQYSRQCYNFNVCVVSLIAMLSSIHPY